MMIVALIMRPWIIAMRTIEDTVAYILADDVLVLCKGERMTVHLATAIDTTHEYLHKMGAKVAPDFVITRLPFSLKYATWSLELRPFSGLWCWCWLIPMHRADSEKGTTSTAPSQLPATGDWSTPHSHPRSLCGQALLLWRLALYCTYRGSNT